nr:hypothetical protein [Tanacetum cinerariifolium]
DKKKEEHLAPTDSFAVPIVDPVPSAEDTDAFETDEFAPTPPPPRHLGLLYHSPRIDSVRHRSRSYPKHLYHFHLSHDLDKSYIITLVTTMCFHMTDIPKAEMPPQKRACFTTPAARFK